MAKKVGINPNKLKRGEATKEGPKKEAAPNELGTERQRSEEGNWNMTKPSKAQGQKGQGNNVPIPDKEGTDKRTCSDM